MDKIHLIKEKFDLTVDMGEIIIASGIFTSISIDGKYYSCQIRYTPMEEIDLSRVEAINSLSRNLERDALSIPEIRDHIEQITTPSATTE